jgi:Starch-binding associating with outer membrane
MKKLSIFSAIIIAGVSFSGCGKSYLDINSPNPNAATAATPELVITNAMTVTASGQVANVTLPPVEFVSGWMGYWAPSGSYAPNNQDVASYFMTTTFPNTYWKGAYRNLEDYYYVETSAKAQQKPYYVAMAKAMKSLVFSQLVDVFNNIPYKEAFQGTLIINPKYDDAQAVYEDLAAQLDTAATLMGSPAAVASANTDVMFYGSPSNTDANLQWIQFANTLKLRLLIRQTQIPGRDAYINGEIAKINANGGGFLDQDAAINPGPDASTPGYANNDQQQNPLWGYFRTLTGLPTSGGQADYWRASQYAINTLNAYNDPRLKFIYGPSGFGTYVGNVLGSQSNIPGEGTSTPGPGLLVGSAQPAIIISKAESHFLQAEAIVRGYLTGDAKAEFEKGVQASFDFLGAGSATTYLASGNPNTTWTAAPGTAGQIAAIIRQKWIAEDGVLPFEAYADFRRLGLPGDIPVSISPYITAGHTNVPVRFLYPVSEYTTNTTNVNAEGNIDYSTNKVFWNQ